MSAIVLTREQSRLLRAIFSDFQHIMANGRLAYQDLQGDGYEVMEYLKNIRTWASGGETDLLDLVATVSPSLHIELSQESEDEEWEIEESEEDEER